MPRGSETRKASEAGLTKCVGFWGSVCLLPETRTEADAP